MNGSKTDSIAYPTFPFFTQYIDAGRTGMVSTRSPTPVVT